MISINSFESALRQYLMNSKLGIRDLQIGDMRYTNIFPAIQIIRSSVSKTNTSLGGAQVALQVSYDISCLFIGQKITESNDFVDSVYEALLELTVIPASLGCISVNTPSLEYGIVEYNDTFITGGVIKLTIEIIHIIGDN